MTNLEEYLTKQMLNPEFQKEWLRQTILEYIQNGDCTEFFNSLERVIKARTTISKFAENIGMNRVQLIDILHGRTKSPSLLTVGKILSGLGYTFSIEDLKSA
ncbi:MAG: hypothetical protein LUE64_00625 [Candidatus Gastranaerophilales bacterium]|nr:hypothetical protein [Candidatus Gastranaerophilales bacterium]